MSKNLLKILGFTALLVTLPFNVELQGKDVLPIQTKYLQIGNNLNNLDYNFSGDFNYGKK